MVKLGLFKRLLAVGPDLSLMHELACQRSFPWCDAMITLKEDGRSCCNLMFQTLLPTHGSTYLLGGLFGGRLMGSQGGRHEEGLEKSCLEYKMKFKK